MLQSQYLSTQGSKKYWMSNMCCQSVNTKLFNNTLEAIIINFLEAICLHSRGHNYELFGGNLFTLEATFSNILEASFYKDSRDHIFEFSIHGSW